MKRRYWERRHQALKILGEKCSKCGSTKDLEIDHRNPKLKVFDGTRMTSVSQEKFLKEIQKCQLLCDKCHNIKNIIERGQKLAKGTHGTLSSYRYCKCDICKKTHSDYCRMYKRTRSSAGVALAS